MPRLLSLDMMDERQRAHESVRAAEQGASRKALGIPPEDVGWRVCLWFIKDGSQPSRAHGPVYLTAASPRETLLTTVIPGAVPDADQGRRLVLAALQALDTDCLDAKRPFLVLCDWLEEHRLPHATLLRAFCGRTQRWLPWNLHSGARLDREAMKATAARWREEDRA